MLEKPDLPDAKISTSIAQEYGLFVRAVTFLPLGADINTAVYRIDTRDEKAYFLKLRNGHFEETAVALPKFLSEQGISQIIPPLPAQSGRLWANLDPFRTILYPFVEGKNGYEIEMSASHWRELGTALKKIHTAHLPDALLSRLRRETFTPQNRESVTNFLAMIEMNDFLDPIAAQVAALLHRHRDVIGDLIRRAGALAAYLRAQPLPLVACHSDIHAGNILLASEGALYLVDWDEPVLAPKERDLMYIGGGLLASGLSRQEEETRFYPTYGETHAHSSALAYYRYERIIQDIAEFCKQLLLTAAGGEDREQSFYYLRSNFLPNNTIDIAYQSDQSQLPVELGS